MANIIRVKPLILGLSKHKGGSTPPPPTNYDPSNLTTGQGIMQNSATPQPVWWDFASRYANNAALKATTFSGIGTYNTPALNGTAGSNSWNNITRTGTRYGDGRFADLFNLSSTPDPAYGFGFSEPCFTSVFYPENLGASTPTPEVRPVFATPIYEVVMQRRLAYCSTPAFTGVGDANSVIGIAFNNGTTPFSSAQNKAVKTGMYGSFASVSGRAGMETMNWNATQGDTFLQFFWAGSTGFPEGTWTLGGTNKTPAFMQAAVPGMEQVILENWVDSGTNYCAATLYRKLDTDPTWTQVSPRIGKSINGHNAFSQFDILCTENMNQSRASQLEIVYMQGAIYDFSNPNNDGSNDPSGCIAQFSAATPDAPGQVQVTGTPTGSTVATTTRVSKYMGGVRYVIDGVTVSGQDYTLLRQDFEVIGDPSAGTTNSTVSKTLTGLALSAGSHTLQAYAINRNGTLLSSTAASTTFNV